MTSRVMHNRCRHRYINSRSEGSTKHYYTHFGSHVLRSKIYIGYMNRHWWNEWFHFKIFDLSILNRNVLNANMNSKYILLQELNQSKHKATGKEGVRSIKWENSIIKQCHCTQCTIQSITAIIKRRKENEIWETSKSEKLKRQHRRRRRRLFRCAIHYSLLCSMFIFIYIFYIDRYCGIHSIAYFLLS